MTKSSMALLIAFGGVACEAAAQEPAAAIEAQQAMVRAAVAADCDPTGDPDEIVVCGRRADDRRHRLPLPLERPAAAADRAGGEQLAAMEAGSSRCTPAGRAQQCNGGLDVIGIGFTVARAILQALQNRD